MNGSASSSLKPGTWSDPTTSSTAHSGKLWQKRFRTRLRPALPCFRSLNPGSVTSTPVQILVRIRWTRIRSVRSSTNGERRRPLPHCRNNPDQPPLAALSVMCLADELTGGSTVAEKRRLLDRFDALLASRDSGFESELYLNAWNHGLPASCLGRLLADQDRPAERWRQSWDRLVEQRRRVQHWQHTHDGDALAPSFFLLTVGLAAIDWLLDPSDIRRDAAQGLWREVFDGAKDCWLTISVSHLLESVEKCIRLLSARHPGCFANRQEGRTRSMRAGQKRPRSTASCSPGTSTTSEATIACWPSAASTPAAMVQLLR